MKIYRRDSGYALVVALMLMALTAFVVREALKRVGVESTIIAASRVSSVSHATVEDALNKAVAFMRDNSHKFAYLFGKENFYDNFQREAIPLYGDNDVSAAQIASNLTIVGTSDVALLSNEPDVFGYENFPGSIDSTTNSGIDLIGALREIDFSGVKVRITLVDAIPVTPAGDTPPKPTTDYTPVWRVDAMAGVDSGPHLFGILEGVPVRPVAAGTYYGIYASHKIYMDGPQNTTSYMTGCSTFSSALGEWGAANRSPNCNVGLANTLIDSSGWNCHTFGSFRSNVSIGISNQNRACAIFTTNGFYECNKVPSTSCSGPGCICMGAGCVESVDWSAYLNNGTPRTFASFCPNNQGDFKVDGETQPLTTAGGKCWSSFEFKKKKSVGGKIILTSNDDYYVQTLNFNSVGTRNASATTSSSSYIRANPPAGGTVRLWFWNLQAYTDRRTIFEAPDPTWFRNGSADTSEATTFDGRPVNLKVIQMNSAINSGSNPTNFSPGYSPVPAIKAFYYAPAANVIMNRGPGASNLVTSHLAIHGGLYAKYLTLYGAVRYDSAGESMGLSLSTGGAGGGGGGGAGVDGSAVQPAVGYVGVVDLTYRLRQAIQVVR